jgi:hypothetical protein
LLPTSPPSPTLDPDALARFAFIRDDAGLFPEDERMATEAQLRDIALRSGVIGVVITAPSADVIDPAGDYAPIIGEARAIGAEVLIALCTPDDCALDTAAAHSEGLTDAVGQVAAAPEPAPGQGLPRQPGLRAPPLGRVRGSHRDPACGHGGALTRGWRGRLGPRQAGDRPRAGRFLRDLHVHDPDALRALGSRNQVEGAAHRELNASSGTEALRGVGDGRMIRAPSTPQRNEEDQTVPITLVDPPGRTEHA